MQLRCTTPYSIQQLIVLVVLLVAAPAAGQTTCSTPGVTATFRSYNTDLSALPNWASSMGVSSEVLQPMTAPGLPQQSSFSVTVGGKQYTSNVAFLWEGYIRIVGPTTRFFQLNSTDGSRLKIDGEVVVDYDGLHPYSPAPVRGSYSFLVDKYYLFRLEAFKGNSPASPGGGVQMGWAIPRMESFVPVPDTAFTTGPAPPCPSAAPTAAPTAAAAVPTLAPAAGSTVPGTDLPVQEQLGRGVPPHPEGSVPTADSGTPMPTRRPSKVPTRRPTRDSSPTRTSTRKPVKMPSKKPSRRPSKKPIRKPTRPKPCRLPKGYVIGWSTRPRSRKQRLRSPAQGRRLLAPEATKKLSRKQRLHSATPKPTWPPCWDSAGQRIAYEPPY